MIRSGIRQRQQGSLSSVCLLCQHRSLSRHSSPHAYSWASNRVTSAVSGPPSFLELHATPSRALSNWGGGPSSGTKPAGPSGGGWGGGWGSGSGLKRDPELEARRARDREKREREEQEARKEIERVEAEARRREEEARKEKERAEREARRAAARERIQSTQPRSDARPPLGSHGPSLIRRINFDAPASSPGGFMRNSDLPPRPARQQPAGSERLPWSTNQPRDQPPQDDERRRSRFWGQAESRFREQSQQPQRATGENGKGSPPNLVRKVGFPPDPSQQLPRATRQNETRSSDAPVQGLRGGLDSPQQPGRSGDPFSSILKDGKSDRQPAKPAKRLDDANQNWDWAEEHIKEAASRPRPSLNQLAGEKGTENSEGAARREGGREEEKIGRFGRSDRLDRPERQGKRQGRPRPRQSAGGEEDDVDLEELKERRRRKAERKAEKERERLAALEAAGPTAILLPEFISVSNLALALGVKPKVFVNQMLDLGFEEVALDSILTGETAAIIAEEYGFDPKVEEGEGRDLKPAPAPEDPSSLPSRPPVVTIMGHVDHGKTTLLDWLRKSSIAAGEHGGITQHIGAFSVKLSSGKLITFLDTPGHAAFTQMRQRGANVTDIAILVVAADDSVKPQTIEALKHARAAKVPIIVAITKVDKPDANVDKVKADLAAQGVEIEDYGGDVQVVGVSGKTGQGMDDLEENILLLSDIMDIRAETDSMAEGWVLESSVKTYGRAATVLVKRGTLRVGDWIVAGTVSCRIRMLRNEAGVEVDEAPPGTAVEVLGWKEPPNAGDQVLQAPTKDKADDAVAYRLEQQDRGDAVAQMAEIEQNKRERERERLAAEAAEAAGEEVEAEEDTGPKIVTFTVKGDVHGSVEAVCAAVQEIGSNEVRPKILMSSPGQITESDIDHAAVSGSCIINFNNPVPGHIKRMAINAKVRILDHNIIYHMVEEVRDVLSELLPPTVSQKVVGEAEILQVFAINVKGRVYKNIAGCRIRNGLITRNSTVRVLRGDKEIFTGPVETLKQGKKAVPEVKKGAECGVSFSGWEDFQQGDQIQVVEEVVTKRRLQ